MKNYLKVEFQVQELKDIEQIKESLSKTFEEEFRLIDTEGIEGSENVQVNVERELAVIETISVVIAFATLIIQLYTLFKEKEKLELEKEKFKLEKEKFEFERAKLEIEKLSDIEREKLMQVFIKEKLPQILQKANVPYRNLDISIYIQE
ncbi:hypothetical protein AMR41_21895 [Hapalosiphon sp. MRB220]|nr:hypothetical protein AMR41_21895 [Hapalosiphon sp. MRB220]